MINIFEYMAKCKFSFPSPSEELLKHTHKDKVWFHITLDTDTGKIIVAMILNIGADTGALAASIRLLIPQMPVVIATLSFTAFIILWEMLIPYSRYVRILKYLTISLLADLGMN